MLFGSKRSRNFDGVAIDSKFPEKLKEKLDFFLDEMQMDFVEWFKDVESHFLSIPRDPYSKRMELPSDALIVVGLGNDTFNVVDSNGNLFNVVISDTETFSLEATVVKCDSLDVSICYSTAGTEIQHHCEYFKVLWNDQNWQEITIIYTMYNLGVSCTFNISIDEDPYRKIYSPKFMEELSSARSIKEIYDIIFFFSSDSNAIASTDESK